MAVKRGPKQITLIVLPSGPRGTETSSLSDGECWDQSSVTLWTLCASLLGIYCKIHHMDPNEKIILSWKKCISFLWVPPRRYKGLKRVMFLSWKKGLCILHTRHVINCRMTDGILKLNGLISLKDFKPKMNELEAERNKDF